MANSHTVPFNWDFGEMFLDLFGWPMLGIRSNSINKNIILTENARESKISERDDRPRGEKITRDARVLERVTSLKVQDAIVKGQLLGQA